MDIKQLIRDLHSFTEKAQQRIQEAKSRQDLEAIKPEVIGKRSYFPTVAEAMQSASNQDRPLLGKELNTARESLKARWKERLDECTASYARVHTIDRSLPPPTTPLGAAHITTRTINEIVAIFERMGFSKHEGPEVEEESINFDDLNIPPFHPARSMQDTFYLSNTLLLRTHTSNTQIRIMRDHTPPVRVISPGRVFRSDADATHAPMFHQMEGFVIDRHISLSHLTWTLKTFLKLFFETDKIQFRIRPSYFPFTQPSAEVDVAFASGAFLEVLGCGMIHHSVLEKMGVNAHKFSGFAFGMGIERLAMLKHGIHDLRPFFECDQRYLKQYRHV